MTTKRCLIHLSTHTQCSYRQVDADVRPVQQAHAAGDDGLGVPRCRDVRDGPLGLPQARFLGMFPDGAPPQRPAQETKHGGGEGRLHSNTWGGRRTSGQKKFILNCKIK